MAKVNDPKRQLFVRLNQLEHNYRLARQGLDTGVIFIKDSFRLALIMMGMALFAFVVRGEGFLNGTHVVLIFLILALACISYFAFYFGRLFMLKVEINDIKKQIEFSVGDSSRNEQK